MRGLRTLAVVGLLAAPANAAADQKDPRLDRLFGVLQTTDDAATAAAVTGMVWAIWTYSEEDDVRRLMTLGIAAMRRLDHAAAQRHFDRVVTLAPDFAEGWNKRATVRFLAGDYPGSLSDVDATLELEPRHFGALSGRGQIHLALGDDARALQAFEDALMVHPHLDGARAAADALRAKLQGAPL